MYVCPVLGVFPYPAHTLNILRIILGTYLIFRGGAVENYQGVCLRKSCRERA